MLSQLFVSVLTYLIEVFTRGQPRVARKVDNAINRIWLSSEQRGFFGNTYPLDKDLSGPACSEAGLRYPVDEC